MATVLPPIVPSVPGRNIIFNADAPALKPADSFLTRATVGNMWCSALALPDGRVAWVQSQPDCVEGDLANNTPGNGSSDSGYTQLWLGFAPDEDTFLTQDDSVTEMTCLLGLDGGALAGRVTAHATLFHNPRDPTAIYMALALGRISSGQPGVTHNDPDFENPETFYGGPFYYLNCIYRSADAGATWDGHTIMSGRDPASVATVRPPDYGHNYPYFNARTGVMTFGLRSISEEIEPPAPPPNYDGPASRPPYLSQGVDECDAVPGVGPWSSLNALINWYDNDADKWAPASRWADRGSNSAGQSKFLTAFSDGPNGTFRWMYSPDNDRKDLEIYQSAGSSYTIARSYFYDDIVDEIHDFEIYDAAAIMWNDGDGMEGLWTSGAVVGAYDNDVPEGLFYVKSGSGDDWGLESLVSQFKFENWPDTLSPGLMVSPGIDYYYVTHQKWVLGIRGTACPVPAPLHIPHKNWGYDDDKKRRKELKKNPAFEDLRVESTDWQFTDNWLEIERWASESTTLGAKCQFHPPKKFKATKRSDKDNYNALRRWVEDGCLCCAAAPRHRLPAYKRQWTHNDMMKFIERWAVDICLNCGETDPVGT